MSFKNIKPEFEIKDVNEVKRQVGLNIKRIRELRSYSQDFVARLVGMDRTHWQRIESNQLEPRIETLSKIADVLQVPLHVLFIPNEANENLKFNKNLKYANTRYFSDESYRKHGWKRGKLFTKKES